MHSCMHACMLCMHARDACMHTMHAYIQCTRLRTRTQENRRTSSKIKPRPQMGGAKRHPAPTEGGLLCMLCMHIMLKGIFHMHVYYACLHIMHACILCTLAC